MAAHSKVSDLKNGILLIEVDHSGWIQMIKTYQKYIMNGLKNKIPELKINALAFKLSGTDIKLAQISEEILSGEIAQKPIYLHKKKYSLVSFSGVGTVFSAFSLTVSFFGSGAF